MCRCVDNAGHSSSQASPWSQPYRWATTSGLTSICLLYTSWRLVGLIFLILAGSALAYIHFHASGHMPASASAGGAIGQSLGRVAVDALNVQGSTLVFFALFLFGLTVFADLSWFKVMDVTGKITLDFFELIQNAFNRWMGARAERKQLVAQLREVDERVAEVVAPSVPDRREQSKACLLYTSFD